jgi:hypothetical protein
MSIAPFPLVVFTGEYRQLCDSGALSSRQLCGLTFPPWLAILVISASVRLLVRAFPPSLPSACAFGFSILSMHRIILLNAKRINAVESCY